MSLDLTETCSCGASLRLSGTRASDVAIAAGTWRKNHHHDFPPTLIPEPTPAVEHHDTTLDALVERADHRDANPKAELDYRTRMGFR